MARALHVVRSGPNPVPWERITDAEAVPAIRRLHCVHYGACLDVALGNRWTGFACHGCGAYERQSDLQERQDLHGIADLIVACPREAEPIGPDDELDRWRKKKRGGGR